MKLQFSGLGWSAAKGPLFWSCPLFLDLFMYYFLKMVTEKSPVKWSYPLFLESAKLEFHCTYLSYKFSFTIGVPELCPYAPPLEKIMVAKGGK